MKCRQLKYFNYIVIAIIIFCLCFCLFDFYKKGIVITNNCIKSILIILLSVVSIVGILINYCYCAKTNIQDKKIEELTKLISLIANKQDEYFYDTLETIQNNREVSLDILEELREKI